MAPIFGSLDDHVQIRAEQGPTTTTPRPLSLGSPRPNHGSGSDEVQRGSAASVVPTPGPAWLVDPSGETEREREITKNGAQQGLRWNTTRYTTVVPGIKREAQRLMSRMYFVNTSDKGLFLLLLKREF